MKTVEVSIEGISPLLMNRFRDVQIEGTAKKRTGALTEMDIKDKLYLDGKGKPYFPASYARGSAVTASKQFKISGGGKRTYSNLVGSSINVLPEAIPLDGEYVPYRIAAVNPMTKGRMMVTRPRFDKWSATFKIELTDDSLPVSVLNEILEHAGRYVGIGDWRPEKKGMFGKFMLTSFKEVK